MSLHAAALALAVATLPPFQQYLRESFPAALQRELRGGGDVWHVRRLPAGAAGKLWIVGAACDEDGCRRTLLFLQKGREFTRVGESKGDAVDASGGEAAPPALTMERRRGSRVERFALDYRDGAYVAGAEKKLVVDPLTREEVSREKLDESAEDDCVAGRDAVAAGRWAALCEAGCTPAQHAKEGRAALRAGAFPEAERALRAALKADPSFAEARLDLGDALAAQGKLGEARVAYEDASRSRDEAVSAGAKDRLARLPR